MISRGSSRARSLTVGLAIAALALPLAACSGEGRPSVEEISKSLTANDSVIPVPEQAADCFAETLHDSDVSDDTLNAIVDQDGDYKGSDDEQQKLTALVASLQTDCADELSSN